MKGRATRGVLALGGLAALLARDAHAECDMSVSIDPAFRPPAVVDVRRAVDRSSVVGSSDRILNKAARVALMREGTRTVLSMSIDYNGPAENFAMVIPVPIVLQQENVKTLPMDVFDGLEQITAPRLVEYWEQDPCPRPSYATAMATNAMESDGEGGGGGSVVESLASMIMPADLGVRVEAKFTTGEYEIQVLSATQSAGLETWLHENHYNTPPGAAAVLGPYIRDQWKWFVAKVDISKAQRRPDGGLRLSPLRFHYDSAEFRLPVRLGLLNAPEAQELFVYVLSPDKRYETANYPNVFIPTNLSVTGAAKSHFRNFYAELFDATLHAAGDRAVVTEYAWSTKSCSPCTARPLTRNELSVLGADVLFATPGAETTAPSHGDFVLTRLHTRYNRNTLTEDLVFQEAQPVQGGRGGASGARGAKQTPTGANTFQARYVLRHPWAGPTYCSNPKRGVWSVKPNSVSPASRPAAALNLGDAPRTGLDLSRVVRSAVPEIGLTGRPAPTPIPNGPPVLPQTPLAEGTVETESDAGGLWEWATRGIVSILSMLGLALISQRRGKTK